MPTELDWPVSGDAGVPTTPQLRINGWSVPVAKADVSREEIGTRERAAGGTMRVTRTAVKEVGEFQTPWIDPPRIAALRAMLRGRGDKWPFSAYATEQNWSSKGLFPTTNGLMPTRLVEDVYSDYGASPVTNPKIGTGVAGCLAAEFGVHNLLSNVASDGTAPNTGSVLIDFWSVPSQANVTPAVDISSIGTGSMLSPVAALTTGSVPISKCYEIDGSGGAVTVVTNKFSVVLGAKYAYSFYVLLQRAGSPTDAPAVTAWLSTFPTGTQSTHLEAAASVDRWTRVQLSIEPAGTEADIMLNIHVPDQYVAFVTALQLEVFTVATPPWHSWLVGGATRATNTKRWTTLEPKPPDDITLAAWVRLGPEAGATFPIAFGPGTGSLRFGWDGINLTFGLVGQAQCTSFFWVNSEWHHIAGVMRQKPSGDRRNYELYVDGVLVSAVNATPASFDGSTKLIGLTVNPSEMLINDLLLLPWAAAPEALAPTYAGSPSAFGSYTAPPFVDVAGDWMGGDEGMKALGDDKKMSSVQGKLSGIDLGMVQQLAFTLTED